MTSIWSLANPQLRDLSVYEPGKPIEETARELGTDAASIIKLASNENPLGPSPKALEAMHRAIKSAHLYPDGGGFYLCRALAQKFGLPADHFILGSGSNEVIEFIGHAFLRRGSEIITPQYSFVVYKLVAKLFDAIVIEIPAPDFQQDLDAIVRAITPATRAIFIANPNNPTGVMVPQEQIDRFMAQVPADVLVVFDEAYFEYVDAPPDTVRFVREGRNVIVLRTFSKIFGLAALRIGYGVASPELIGVLQKARQPFNTSAVAQAAALAALGDEDHQQRTKTMTDQGRAWLQEEFTNMKLPFVPSFGNFVLVHVGDGAAVFQELLRRRIIVRPVKGYGLPEWLRISVGTKEQNEACVAALRVVLSSKLSC